MTSLTTYLSLASNKLCGDIPPEVEAWAAGISTGNIDSGNSIGTYCPGTPEAALSTLYEAATGGGWTNNINWLDRTADVCTWDNVVCNSNGDVTGLELQNNNLVGSVCLVCVAAICGSLNSRTCDPCAAALSCSLLCGCVRVRLAHSRRRWQT